MAAKNIPYLPNRKMVHRAPAQKPRGVRLATLDDTNVRVSSDYGQHLQTFLSKPKFRVSGFQILSQTDLCGH